MQIANHDKKLFLISFDLAGYFVHLASVMFPSLHGIINFGFRSIQKEVVRGIAGDVICNTPCPTLFIMGTNSKHSDVNHLKLYKKNFTMPVGSVIVGYADHNLKVNENALIKMGISQSCVDRMVVVSNFKYCLELSYRNFYRNMSLISLILYVLQEI